MNVADPQQFPDSAIRHTALAGIGGGAGSLRPRGGSSPVGSSDSRPSGCQPPLGGDC